MTVADLIAELQKLDPKMTVLTYDESRDMFRSLKTWTEHEAWLIDTAHKTRDWKKVLPPGTTKKFLCF